MNDIISILFFHSSFTCFKMSIFLSFHIIHIFLLSILSTFQGINFSVKFFSNSQIVLKKQSSILNFNHL